MPTSPEDEETNELKPPFQVMRANEVQVRDAKDDRRLFYFDDTTDIVAVTISKRHIEPAHLHTFNTESYYVIRGKLLLSVEGQDVWLDEGDLMIVNPGACHRFETTEQEVMFIAIKKVAGLDDKRSC